MQNLNEKIDQKYRVRLILDNLPVTTYDLEENPESVRPGYELGYEKDDKHYVNNHLMFKILVHQTNGQYTRAKENMAEIEAAAIVEVPSIAHAKYTRSHTHNKCSTQTSLSTQCIALSCSPLCLYGARGTIAQECPYLMGCLPARSACVQIVCKSVNAA